MFNIGFFELLTVAGAALLILGPERFPQAARSLARFIYELRRAFFDARSGFDDMKAEGKKLLKPGFDDMKTEGKKLLEEAGVNEFFSKEGLPEDSSITDRPLKSAPPKAPSAKQNPSQPENPPHFKSAEGAASPPKEAPAGEKKASSKAGQMR